MPSPLKVLRAHCSPLPLSASLGERNQAIFEMVGTRNRQAQDIKKSLDFQRESLQTGLFSRGSLFSYPLSFLGKYP